MTVSLRTRVLFVLLLLAVLGLGSAAVITNRLVNSFLIERLDAQLETERFRVFGQLQTQRGQMPSFGQNVLTASDGTYAQLVSADGTVEQEFAFGAPVDAPKPILDKTITGEHWYTTGSIPAGTSYRVYVAPFGQGDKYLIYARPLTEIEDTMRRLTLIEVGVSVGVLIGSGLLGFFAIRSSLKPLQRVVETADAIAAGDITRRVERSDTRTEVGKLGRTFNAMITEMEQMFARQRVVEQRLRTFVADASHELRPPLTPIRGYVELLARPDLTPADRAYSLSRIREASERMHRLVDDLLLLARLDEQPVSDFRMIDLTGLIHGAVADARAADGRRQWTDDIEDGIVVLGDEHHVARLIENVLTNVRVHTPIATTAAVSLRALGDTAVVEIRDNGPGIPQEVQQRVFDRFARGDPSRAGSTG